jgi:hypothetical protein
MATAAAPLEIQDADVALAGGFLFDAVGGTGGQQGRSGQKKEEYFKVGTHAQFLFSDLKGRGSKAARAENNFLS